MADSRDQPLDLYLDGLLSPRERALFEAELAEDPALRAQVEWQRRVDDALRRAFAPPPAESVLGPPAASKLDGRAGRALPPAPPGRKYASRSALRIAAAIALAAVAVWRLYGWISPRAARDPYAPQAWRSLETVYRDKLADGFTVDWECKDDAEFQRTFRTRLGQPLLLATLPANIRSLGLGYCNSISERTVFLLARVDGQEVIVFVDRLDQDKPQPSPSDAKLRLFRREIDKLVAYELTPLPEAQVLDSLFNPKAKPAP
jgi:hypothetical protein